MIIFKKTNIILNRIQIRQIKGEIVNTIKLINVFKHSKMANNLFKKSKLN